MCTVLSGSTLLKRDVSDYHSHDAHHNVEHYEAASDLAEKKKRLWQKLFYLQYLKKLFNKYKHEYEQEYHGVDTYNGVTAEAPPLVVHEKSFPTISTKKRPRVVFTPSRVPTVVTIERPSIVRVPDVLPSVPSPPVDYDYVPVDFDYAPVDYDYDYAPIDYAEYYDYAQDGCDTGCALSKIIRAVQLKKKKKTAEGANTGISAGSVKDDGDLLKRFREFLSESKR